MINHPKFRHLLLLLIATLTLSCQKDEKQAINSLEGQWQVTTINSFYSNGEETVEETGELGTFSFDGDMVEYSFTRNDTFFQNLRPWKLTAEKVRKGFFKVTEFQLEIEGDFLFDVQFEDGTNNAEKNARNMSWNNHDTTPEAGVNIEMELTKE